MASRHSRVRVRRSYPSPERNGSQSLLDAFWLLRRNFPLFTALKHSSPDLDSSNNVLSWRCEPNAAADGATHARGHGAASMATAMVSSSIRRHSVHTTTHTNAPHAYPLTCFWSAPSPSHAYSSTRYLMDAHAKRAAAGTVWQHTASRRCDAASASTSAEPGVRFLFSARCGLHFVRRWSSMWEWHFPRFVSRRQSFPLNHVHVWSVYTSCVCHTPSSSCLSTHGAFLCSLSATF